MQNLPTRFDAEEMILDAAEARLNSRKANGLALEEVKSVTRGDTASTNPKDPVIWIGEGETRAVIDERSLQFSDTNTFDLVIQSEVRDRKPGTGPKKARRLAAVAGQELLKGDDGQEDYRLGLGRWIVNVQFVRASKGPSSRRDSVYTHAGVYRVTYKAQR